MVYGAVMIVISLFYNAIWYYLMRHAEDAGGREQPADAARLGPAVRHGPGAVEDPAVGIGLVGYGVGTLVAAFVSAGAALAVYGLLAVYYLFNHLPSPPRDAPAPGG